MVNEGWAAYGARLLLELAAMLGVAFGAVIANTVVPDGPPSSAVLPSPESATAEPCAEYEAPRPASLLPCWIHWLPIRLNTQAPPSGMLSGTPSRAVFPSLESATGPP